jgi:hypothetical protein
MVNTTARLASAADAGEVLVTRLPDRHLQPRRRGSTWRPGRCGED